MAALNNIEIMKIVNHWIGVSGGYLGDFSYRTHADFYPEYCGLDIDPNSIEGTTRERFIQIVSNASPKDQAKILRGVLERFPTSPEHPKRTPELYGEIHALIQRLEGISPIAFPTLPINSQAVEQAIADAEALINKNGAVSAVDRVHTVTHGYLAEICKKAGITYPPDATLTKLFRLIREQHPSFANLGPRSQDISKILNSSAAILDALTPLRNKASLAHPNESLLGTDEAMLVINVTKTLLHYLNAKI